MPPNNLEIIGNGVISNFTVLYLSKKIPELNITIIGESELCRAILGKYTFKLSAHFLKNLV